MSVFDVDSSSSTDFIHVGDLLSKSVSISKIDGDCINLTTSQYLLELGNDSKEALRKYIQLGIHTFILEGSPNYIHLEDFDFQGSFFKSRCPTDLFPRNSIKYRNILKDVSFIIRNDCSVGRAPGYLQTVRGEYILDNVKIDCRHLIVYPGMYNYVLKDTKIACGCLILLYATPESFKSIENDHYPEDLLKNIRFGKCKAVLQNNLLDEEKSYLFDNNTLRFSPIL